MNISDWLSNNPSINLLHYLLIQVVIHMDYPTLNDMIDMEEDYLAEKLNKNLISEEDYNKRIDYLEELRE